MPGDGQNKITRVYTLPPGTPKDRVAVLQKAYKAVMEGPGLSWRRRRRRALNIDYVSPKAIAEALKAINNMPPAIKEYLQILTGFKKGRVLKRAGRVLKRAAPACSPVRRHALLLQLGDGRPASSSATRGPCR